jgi:threonine-phosphate decarboxylase
MFAPAEDLPDSIQPGVEMVFLCQPNNPTGRLIPADLLGRVLDRASELRSTVVVDECFLDFTNAASIKNRLAAAPGLVVLKAFTKTHAMAGLRLGYLLTSDRTLIGKAQACAQSWSVSVPAQIAGIAALACEGWLERTRLLVAKERTYMTENLTAAGITVFPSEANYLLLRCERPLAEPLLRRGILVRSCANFHGLDATYIRIGLKTGEKNKILLEAIIETLA